MKKRIDVTKATVIVIKGECRLSDDKHDHISVNCRLEVKRLATNASCISVHRTNSKYEWHLDEKGKILIHGIIKIQLKKLKKGWQFEIEAPKEIEVKTA